MQRLSLKQGTLCYVVTSCRASPSATAAVGKIVEVVAGPYERSRKDGRITCYDVGYHGVVFYCDANKLRPINDPDADVGEPQDGTLTM